MRRVLLILISFTLLAAACGDDSAETGDSAADFCEQAREIETVRVSLDSADDYRAFASAVDDAKGSAPAAISDAVDTVSEFLDAMVEALDANDDNVILAFDEVQLNENLDEFEAAGDAIAAYNETNCGIADDDDDDDDEVDEVDDSQFDGSIVALLADQLGISEDEARCLVEELDLAPGESPDPSAVIGALGACGIDPLSIAGDG